MSGSFLEMDVPPTLISFAIAPVLAGEVVTPEFKEAGHPVYRFAPKDDSAESQKAAWDAFHGLCQEGKVKAAWAAENGLADAVMQMSFGNRIGFQSREDGVNWFGTGSAVIVAELAEDVDSPYGRRIGVTSEEPVVSILGDSASIDELSCVMVLGASVQSWFISTHSPSESSVFMGIPPFIGKHSSTLFPA